MLILEIGSLGPPKVRNDGQDAALAARKSAAKGTPNLACQYETAVALYHGQFLQGFEVRDSVLYEEWLQQERDRWQQRILAVYPDLIDHQTDQDQLDAAILRAKQMLRIDPLQEQLRCGWSTVSVQPGPTGELQDMMGRGIPFPTSLPWRVVRRS